MLGAMFVLFIAQAPPVQPQAKSWSVGLTSELSRESWRFHFDNPSTYDTEELVPHFFEQTYDLDSVWLGARMAHPAGSYRGELAVLLTPQRTRRADDFDTFFQPDGNVVVTGTTGGASVRSWRIAERLQLGRWRGTDFTFEYAYHRHRARYHDGDGITTTTLPPSITHRLVTTRETTISELHELKWSVARERRAAGGTFDGAIGVVPVTFGRLTVDLPDKYPGRLLVFQSRVGAIDGRLGYNVIRPRLSWRIGVRAGSTFGWRSRALLDARAVALTLDVIPR